jgi:hypothetical protein
LAEAKADLRDKVERHEHGAAEPLLDPKVTLGRYLEWWVNVELAERVADGAIVETTRQQYANKVRFQIVPYLGDVILRDLSAMRVRQWMTVLARAGASTTRVRLRGGHTVTAPVQGADPYFHHPTGREPRAGADGPLFPILEPGHS